MPNIVFIAYFLGYLFGYTYHTLDEDYAMIITRTLHKIKNDTGKINGSYMQNNF